MHARTASICSLLVSFLASTSCLSPVKRNTAEIERSVSAVRANTDVVLESTRSMGALIPSLQKVDQLRGPLQSVAGLDTTLQRVAELGTPLRSVATLEKPLTDAAGLGPGLT